MLMVRLSRYAVVLPLLLVSPATSASVPSPALKRIPRHDHLRADTGHGVTATSRPGHVPTAEPTDEDRQEIAHPAALRAASRTLSPEPWVTVRHRAEARAADPASLRNVRSRAPPC